MFIPCDPRRSGTRLTHGLEHDSLDVPALQGEAESDKLVRTHARGLGADDAVPYLASSSGNIWALNFTFLRAYNLTGEKRDSSSEKGLQHGGRENV